MNKSQGYSSRWGISSGDGPAFYDEKRLKPLGLYCQGGSFNYDNDIETRTFHVYSIKDKSFVAELLEPEFNLDLLRAIRRKKLEKINENAESR